MNPTATKYRKPRTPLIIPAAPAHRAATKYTEDENGCWISTYSVASHGYAQIGWKDDHGKMRGTTAHRAAWVHHNGEQIPEGHTVDHLCKTIRCVRPDHLRALPNFENARRTFGRDWPEGECANGHPNSNLRVIDSRGRLGCGVCFEESKPHKVARQRERRRALRAA